jgi:hypothetical protein
MGAQLTGAGMHALLESGQVGGEPVRQFGAAREARDSGADLGQAAWGNHELTGGEQDHFFDGPQAALVGWIEDAHGIDLVAEKLDADRQRRRRWEDIDEAAATGELSATGHLLNGFVAELQQIVKQLVLMDAGAHSKAARLGGEFFGIQGVLKESLDTRHEDAGTAGAPGGQRGDASRGLVADQLAALVGKSGSGFQDGHRVEIAEPGLQFLGDAVADLGIAGDPYEPLPGERRSAVPRAVPRAAARSASRPIADRQRRRQI